MSRLRTSIRRHALAGALLGCSIVVAGCGGSDTTVAVDGGTMATAQARKPAGWKRDNTAPSSPQGLALTANSPTSISASWSASTDNVGVARYRVYRCTGGGCTPGTLVASPATTSYRDDGLSANTSYSYSAVAEDAAGNLSTPSAVATATTPAAPTSVVDGCPSTTGRTLEVGPGKAYATPSAASAAAQSGDRILIAAGDYVGDVTTWYASNLVICGSGGRARLFANGNNAQGKGIWVVAVPNTATTTIVNVEFHQATVRDKNGAGIRLDGGNLVLRNTGFYDNENGILGGAGGTTVTIERSEFARNGYGDGYTHNIYIGNVSRLDIRASYFHEAKVGHNLKSRARETYIENSYFADGTSGTSSYLIDTPNGGVVFLRGNLLHKGPYAENSVAVSYGAEGLSWTTNTLTMAHNTVVSGYSGGAFVYAPSATQQVTLTANLFAGTNGPALLIGGVDAGKLAQQGNVVTTATNVPGGANGNFWPVSTLQAQLQLSQVLDAQYVNDSPQPYTLRPIADTGARLSGALQAQP